MQVLTIRSVTGARGPASARDYMPAIEGAISNDVKAFVDAGSVADEPSKEPADAC
jgi:hypothetical protein